MLELKEVIWRSLEAETTGKEDYLQEHHAVVAVQMEENTRRKDEARAKLLKIQPDSAQPNANTTNAKDGH